MRQNFEKSDEEGKKNLHVAMNRIIESMRNSLSKGEGVRDNSKILKLDKLIFYKLFIIFRNRQFFNNF